MKTTKVTQIEYVLPKNTLSSEDMVRENSDWDIDKIEAKTGIKNRYTATEECSSDLGIAAAIKLFENSEYNPEDIDFILFCTQSPDYFLPTTACLVQDKLGIPITAGALDFNLGCSGFVYGLGLAKGLIETGQANNLLLITAETYTKYIHPKDKSVRTLFGDAGAAVLLQGVEQKKESIGPFIYGTDGRGAENLIVPHGAQKFPISKASSEESEDSSGNVRTPANLYMNGSKIFSFTLNSVPKALSQLYQKADLNEADIDLFVFHQANKFMLDQLQSKIGIADKKMYRAYEDIGNTVSCTIPIAIKRAQEEGKIKPGDVVALVGFGVGYSWGATIVRF